MLHILTLGGTYLDYQELQEVLVVLGSLEHLFHRNDQGVLGSLETQDFPVCLWDL